MSGSNDLLGDLVAKAQRGARGETGALVLLERETEMRNLSKKAKTIIAGAAIAGLASAGGAYAYWTASGSGSGTAATSAGVNGMTFTQTSVITNMYPGDSAQALTGTINNTQPSGGQSQYVTTVTITKDSVSGAGTSSLGCTIADYDLAGGVVAVNQDIAAASNFALPSGATVKFHNSTANQNDCKGATLHLLYTIS